MNAFRPVDAAHIAAAHTAYMSVYDWLNGKGVRQWLPPRQRRWRKARFDAPVIGG